MDKHREAYTDLEWASIQDDSVIHEIGDIVEFHEGGYGVIKEVSSPCDGSCYSYSTEEIEGVPFHPRSITAWHYTGDFKVLQKSPVHNFPDTRKLGGITHLERLCVNIYLCLHVSERNKLHKPIQEAWDIGQELYNHRKR